MIAIFAILTTPTTSMIDAAYDGAESSFKEKFVESHKCDSEKCRLFMYIYVYIPVFLSWEEFISLLGTIFSGFVFYNIGYYIAEETLHQRPLHPSTNTVPLQQVAYAPQAFAPSSTFQTMPFQSSNVQHQQQYPVNQPTNSKLQVSYAPQITTLSLSARPDSNQVPQHQQHIQQSALNTTHSKSRITSAKSPNLEKHL